jgi:hypothetical protein
MSPSESTPVATWYRSGWKRWWLVRSTTTTSTGARRSAFAANSPAKPQPTMTTRCMPQTPAAALASSAARSALSLRMYAS